MTESSRMVVDSILRDLNRIPKDITSKISIKGLLKRLEEEIKRQNRRRNSYVK